jgi:hypothetical protein
MIFLATLAETTELPTDAPTDPPTDAPTDPPTDTTQPPLICATGDETQVKIVGTNYIKTACIVNIAVSQAEAKSYCESNSMKFFIIDSEETQTEIFKYFETLDTNNVDKVFRIDGERSASDGNWYTSDFALVIDQLKWLVSSDTFDTYDFLMISNMAWPLSKIRPTFTVDGIDGETVFPFICEYIE